ncbi:MAG: rubredoxin [Clostridiales bacterium]|nr:rubredoxin [Clostridiales bacterium]
MTYECICGYVYDESAGDPEHGIAPGTKWKDLPDDFVCPACGLGKAEFVQP